MKEMNKKYICPQNKIDVCGRRIQLPSAYCVNVIDLYVVKSCF